MTEEERTIALIAGNILTGRMPFGGGGKEADVKAVTWAVQLATMIVNETIAPDGSSPRDKPYVRVAGMR
jgi:hypothetical protein